MHKYKTGGEVGNRMSNVIVKENESLDSSSSQIQEKLMQKQEFSRIFVKETLRKASVRRKKKYERS